MEWKTLFIGEPFRLPLMWICGQDVLLVRDKTCMDFWGVLKLVLLTVYTLTTPLGYPLS